MDRRRLVKSWVIVWGVLFIFGGLILCVEYQSSLSDLSREIPQTLINETAQAVSSHTAQNAGSSIGKKISVTKAVESSNNFDQDREFQEELKLVFGQINAIKKPLELKDFPSPVNGNPLRNVGNYYSEASNNYVFHAGVDYALSEGTVIRATHGGKVVLSMPDSILGQKVTLDCGEGWLVTYGGLDNLRVQEGEVVEIQEALGQVGFFPGAEGESNQPQLHYEVWHHGQVQWQEP